MEYQIVFYTSESGDTPMLEFLASLQDSHGVLHKLLTAGLGKLRNRDNHGAPLTAPVRGSPGHFEMRVGRTDIARVFFFFQPNRATLHERLCEEGHQTGPARNRAGHALSG